MRTTILFAAVALIFSACKKDKYTTAPQIKFKSVDPNYTSTDIGATIPTITFSITDAEGDIGFKQGSDTAFIYAKNNLTGKSDSLIFPDLLSASKSDLKADVTFSTSKFLDCRTIPGPGRHIDTLYFTIYVKDFAENKSNVIITDDPIYFNCQ